MNARAVAFAFAAATAAAATVAVHRNHPLRSRLLGFEGAGAAIMHRDLAGKYSLVVFTGERKGKTQDSLSGGKCELSDLLRAAPLFFAGVNYPVARCTAARETWEETNGAVDLDPRELMHPVVTGAGKTATGQPVVWFMAVRGDQNFLNHVPGSEFTSVALVSNVDPGTFRAFNKACMAAIAPVINGYAGYELIKPAKPKP